MYEVVLSRVDRDGVLRVTVATPADIASIIRFAMENDQHIVVDIERVGGDSTYGE